MADRQDSEREVLTSLPRSRPVRRSAKRDERPAAPKGAATAQRRKAAGKPPRAAKATAAGTPKGTAPKTAVAKTAAARTVADATAPMPAAEPKKARATGTRSARQKQPPRDAPPRKVPPAGYAAPTSRAGEQQASGAADLIGTTLQAAAELTQIGLAVGRQTLQSMLERLPKP